MTSFLDLKAYALRVFFNSLGRLGGTALNFACTRNLDVFANLSYGPEKEQCLDIFRPKTIENANLPVLAFFHGGGWVASDKKIHMGIATTFARNGFLTFNVNYRLAPEHRFPAPLEDAVRAIDWIDRNAVRFGGDRSAIVLAGDSSGAHIASWYVSALHNRNLLYLIGAKRSIKTASVKGLLLFYGVYDFDAVLGAHFPFIKTYARCFLGADPQTYEMRSRLASPIKQIPGDFPPVWICAGEKDGLFSQSQAYANALKKRGVTCRTLFFSSDYRANHGFLFFKWFRSSKTAVADAVEFIHHCTDKSSTS